MILYRYRFLIVLAFALLVSLSFWTGSRYPALNEKAMMAESGSVADTLSVWPILEIKRDDPVWKKIVYTTVNWTNDNKKGMSFGVVIGALFLTLVRYLQFRQKSHKMLNTLYGFLLGSPLGVCVNCAAPVFKGVLQSKHAELAFAMMLSSPTMNIVVLTMVFTLFPFYMAVTKVLFVLAMIFLGVPIISKILGPNHKINDWIKVDSGVEKIGQNCDTPVQESVGKAIIGSFLDFGRSLKFMIVRTVPLMFLAGFLGSFVSHLVPLEMMMGYSGVGVTLLTAAVGIFLPCPVAFDVILTNALFSAGLAPSLTLVLLCTLGIFSAYSFMITWTSASKQWALSITGLAYALAVMLGVNGDWLHENFYIQPNIRNYQQLMSQGVIGTGGGAAKAEGGEAPLAEPPSLTQDASVVYEDERLRIKQIPFAERQASIGKFKALEGQKIGLARGFMYGIRDYPDPFWVGRGTAAGDYNQDGWVDIAFGSDEGIFLYRNQGGRFQQDYRLPAEIASKRIYAVAFVDWNGDGWLDLFATTFNQGNFVVLNEDGQWADATVSVPSGDGVLTVSPTFADFDGNDRLDVFNGNMALGVITASHKYGQGRENVITYQTNDGYKETVLDRHDGESMATLAADFDDDGWLDIYVSNDFKVPDQFYRGTPTSGFEPTQQPLRSPFYSMGIDTGDFNNDLNTDFVVMGTVSVQNQPPMIDGVSRAEYQKLNLAETQCQSVEGQDKPRCLYPACETLESEVFRANCRYDAKVIFDKDFLNLDSMNQDVTRCKVLKDKNQRDQCLLAVMWKIVTNRQQLADCQEQFGFDEQLVEVCELYRRRGEPYQKDDFKDELQQENRHFVYLGDGQGSFQSVPFDHPGGWTWSSKIADLDNDRYQDIFNAEGAVRNGGFGFNVVMRNRQGEGFEQKQFSWNLDDPFYLFSFAYIDFDNDGDLDIIGNSSIGPVQVYENRLNEHGSIAIAVRKAEGNTQGLHSRITIEDDQGRAQFREIKAGGGYQSFDPYRAYFGLKDSATIRSLKIERIGDEPIVLERSLPANHFYLVELK